MTVNETANAEAAAGVATAEVEETAPVEETW